MILKWWFKGKIPVCKDWLHIVGLLKSSPIYFKNSVPNSAFVVLSSKKSFSVLFNVYWSVQYQPLWHQRLKSVIFMDLSSNPLTEREQVEEFDFYQQRVSSQSRSLWQSLRLFFVCIIITHNFCRYKSNRLLKQTNLLQWWYRLPSCHCHQTVYDVVVWYHV